MPGGEWFGPPKTAAEVFENFAIKKEWNLKHHWKDRTGGYYTVHCSLLQVLGYKSPGSGKLILSWFFDQVNSQNGFYSNL